MNETGIRVEFADGFAQLIFDQPNSRANILSQALWTEFEHVLQTVARQPHRGLLLTSARPGIFIAGADLKFLAEAMANDPTPITAFIEHGNLVLNLLEQLPFPTVALVDGAALGGGMEVALACDAIVMGSHPKAQLGLPEINLGLIPGWGGTQRLTRLVGVEEAVDRLLSGESYAANDPPPEELAILVDSAELHATASGLLKPETALIKRRLKLAPLDADELPGKDILPELMATLETLEPQKLLAAQSVLAVVLQGARLPLEQAIGQETAAFLTLVRSEEARELVQAFFQKRAR